MKGSLPVQHHTRRVRIRILFLTLLLGVVALTILWRLVVYQLLLSDSIRDRARQQQEGIIELSPSRGAIYDARGRELAVSVSIDSLFVDPGRFSGRPADYRRLARALGLPTGRVRSRIENGGRRFAWVARQISPETRARIEALEIDGTGFISEYRRFYPKGTLGAHLLGYVGVDDQGLAGIEYLFNERIEGRPGLRFAYRDGDGVKIPLEIDEPALDGRSLVLTVDEVIQHVVERELDRAFRATGARGGTAILIEPDTGRILALANRPTYDPNRFGDFPASFRRNRAVTDCFEPGSTFKVFTFALAWQDGHIRDGERIDCRHGSVRIAGRTIHDHHPFGDLTVSEILAESSNVGAILVGRRIPEKRFYQFLAGFGFGEPTGIRIPGENAGILHSPDQWSKTSAASLAIGHEICVNAVQLTAALTSVVNGGILYRPWVVRAIGDGNGNRVEEYGPSPGTRVLPAAVSERMRREMWGTVEEGTGRAARLARYSVGGKTGTAQKPEKIGGYSSTRYVSSFFGFAPVSRPRIAMLILLDEPKGRYYGGDVAAPVFARVAPEVLHYLRVPPEKGAAPAPAALARLEPGHRPGRGAAR